MVTRQEPPEVDEVLVAEAIKKLAKRGKIPRTHLANCIDKVEKGQMEPLSGDRKGQWKVVLGDWRAIVEVDGTKAVVLVVFPRGDNY